jgi:acyl-CoA synthetase (AMP-forming)/AMP-acid ligase II
VAVGYWERPEESGRSFQARLAGSQEGIFLRSGDLGFLRERELYITGRHKDMIIIRGRNHYPQDIEWTAESSHPALRRGCSAAFAVEVGGEERLVLVAELEQRFLERRNPNLPPGVDQRLTARREDPAVPPDAPVDPAEVIREVKQQVAERHELRPYEVVLIKTIPKTSSGKIQRHACKFNYLNNRLEKLE